MTRIPFPSEQFIEQYLFDEINGYECPLTGDPVTILLRQKEIKGYGVADLIKITVYEDQLVVTVMEIKNETLKESHLSQLSRYMVGVKRILKKYIHMMGRKPKVFLNGELVGPFSPNANDLCYLAQFLDNIKIYDIGVTMDDGFVSNQIDDSWYSRGENLKSQKALAREIYEEFKQQKSINQYLRECSKEGQAEGRGIDA